MLKTQAQLDAFNASLRELFDDDLGADMRELFKREQILFDLDDTGEIIVILFPPEKS